MERGNQMNLSTISLEEARLFWAPLTELLEVYKGYGRVNTGMGKLVVLGGMLYLRSYIFSSSPQTEFYEWVDKEIAINGWKEGKSRTLISILEGA